MGVKILLGLRKPQLELVQVNGSTRQVLGTAYPQEDQRRQEIQQRWGGVSQNPRRQQLASIDEPLPQRTQTILSYQVDVNLRHRLNTGMGRLASSRQVQQSAEKVDLLLPD